MSIKENRNKGCLQLVFAFTVFAVILKVLGYTDISWFWLTWWLWLPFLLVVFVIIFLL